MTDAAAPAIAEFQPLDSVRLLARREKLPSGSVGRIIGSDAPSDDQRYLVSFETVELCVVNLRGSEIVLVDDVRASA